jgi:acyl CoA:acetate/3-ketoacid CoA transferase alpha subunit
MKNENFDIIIIATPLEYSNLNFNNNLLFPKNFINNYYNNNYKDLKLINENKKDLIKNQLLYKREFKKVFVHIIEGKLNIKKRKFKK